MSTMPSDEPVELVFDGLVEECPVDLIAVDGLVAQFIVLVLSLVVMLCNRKGR